MTDASGNLTFALPLFNHPKILLNDSKTITAPAFATTTVLIVDTGATTTPLPPRINVELNGTLAPAFGSSGDTQTVLGVPIAFIVSFNASQQLVVQAVNDDLLSDITVTLWYRVYVDAKPS